MKVQTNLKAGNFLQNASNQMGALWQGVSGFVDKANQDARDITGKTIATASIVSNCLVSSLNRR